VKRQPYDRWIGKHVRRKAQPDGPVGMIVAPGKFNTWWLVEWPDGSRKLYPRRDLVEVADEQSR
jgi:hypothetical protein